jgi:quercetin dioxygenase-like cupin family protein
MTINFEELAALDAAGALTPDERRDFESALAAAPAAVRAEVAELREVAASIAASVPVQRPGSVEADAAPSPGVRSRLMSRLGDGAPAVPPGFSFRFAHDDEWLPHPVPGIRMKVLALNRKSGYATLLLDVAPGTRFPAHHHPGAEECYVISGSMFACGRRMSAGDFHHADAGSDHGELWTEEGCRVLMVVPSEDELPDPPR